MFFFTNVVTTTLSSFLNPLVYCSYVINLASIYRSFVRKVSLIERAWRLQQTPDMQMSVRVVEKYGEEQRKENSSSRRRFRRRFSDSEVLSRKYTRTLSTQIQPNLKRRNTTTDVF